MAAMIAACFLFAMGNKPRASKVKYRVAIYFFSVMMVYILVASVLCAITAARQGGTANSAMLFSVIITYGVYAASSVLSFDPAHMVTSFIQYLLLSPTYFILLNIYSFSNLDDISWGTKQDTIEEQALAAVTHNTQNQVCVMLPFFLLFFPETNLGRHRAVLFGSRSRRVLSRVSCKPQIQERYPKAADLRIAERAEGKGLLCKRPDECEFAVHRFVDYSDRFSRCF
jgi:hypothetical protein